MLMFLFSSSPLIPEDPAQEAVYEENQEEESRLLLQMFPRPANVAVGQIPLLNEYLREGYLTKSGKTTQDDMYRHASMHVMYVMVSLGTWLKFS